MAFADLEDIRLHYDFTGDGSLPVLAFSNSLGANLAMWEPQLAALTPHFGILRYDTRGHGRSSAPPGPFMIADLAGDLLRLLDALHLNRVHFCGLSLGGIVGQWLGIHAGDRLNKLVLANTAARIGTKEGWDARIDLVLREGLQPVIPGTLQRWFTPAFHEQHPSVIAATAAMIAATGAPAYAHCCGAIRDVDFRSEVARIRTPTLVLSGSNDPVTPPADGRYLADKIPDASYTELPAAHLSNVEAASAFNQALLGFVGESTALRN